MATRLEQLQGIAKAFPAANQKVQQQLDATRQIQLQQQVGQAPAQGISQVQPIAQQIGQQATQAQAGQQLQAQQAQANQQTQLGQLALQAQGAQNRQQLAGQQSLAQRDIHDISRDLAKVDFRLKNQLIDQQIDIKKNAAGRALLNESQLQDYAITKAKNDIELNKYAQMMEQASKKKLYMLQQANKLLLQAVQQGYLQEGQELTQAQQKELAYQQKALESKIQREQAAAANRQAMFGAIGTVVGATAGAFAGGPAGAAAGAQLGSAAGNIASTQT
jgi:hypothetical protein